MSEIALVAPVGTIVVLAFLYLRRTEGGAAASYWAWAWVAVWISGLFTVLDESLVVSRAIGNLIGSFFTLLVVAGVFAFMKRPLPRWIPALVVAMALSRVGLALAEERTLSYAIAPILDFPLCMGAAILLWRDVAGRRPGLAERLLAPTLGALAIVLVIDPVARARGIQDQTMLLSGWIVISTALMIFQLLAILERSLAREARLRLEGEAQAQQLEAGQRTLRSILETAPVGVFVFDRAQRLTLLNRTAAKHLSVAEPERWLGERADSFIASHAPHLEKIPELVEEARITSLDARRVIREREVPADEHQRGQLMVSSSPVVTDAGEQLGRVWVTRDVTEERALEAQLRQGQKMETLGTLAGGVAHDFNNQLTAILGNAHLLLEGMSRDDPSRRGLEDLTSAAEHCARLTQGLLAFSRQTPVVPSPVRVGTVLARAESLLKACLPSSIELQVELPATLRSALTDPTQLEQIVLNLVVNARDAIAMHGRIRIHAENLDLAPGSLLPDPEAKPGRYVVLHVEDTGSGMDDAVRDRAFDPFFTTKPTGQGTGLGLAVVYGLVRAHGGWVELDTTPDVGTRFSVVLPAAADEAPADALGADDGPRAGHETILIADDEPAVRRLARWALERRGYRVIEASDGEEALDCFETRPDEIDLVVLDLTMPRCDGLTALARLRERRPELPALLASGHLDARPPSRRPEDFATLAKPYTPSELARRVRQALDDASC